jgi:hypothetical protein
MPIVRTTMRPDQPIEVGDVEYADLKAQGLLVEDAHTTEAPAASAPPVTTKKTSAGNKES